MGEGDDLLLVLAAARDGLRDDGLVRFGIELDRVECGSERHDDLGRARLEPLTKLGSEREFFGRDRQVVEHLGVSTPVEGLRRPRGTQRGDELGLVGDVGFGTLQRVAQARRGGELARTRRRVGIDVVFMSAIGLAADGLWRASAARLDPALGLAVPARIAARVRRLAVGLAVPARITARV